MHSSLPLPATTRNDKKRSTKKGGFPWLSELRQLQRPKTPLNEVLELQETQSGAKAPTSDHGDLPQVTVPDVLEVMRMYKKFSIPSILSGVELTDMVNVCDVTQYWVTEAQRDKLWEEEATRLVDVINNGTADNTNRNNKPLEFKGSLDLAVDSKESYQILIDLADQVWNARNIIVYDGESICAAHSKGLYEPEVARSSRIILDTLLEREDNKENGGKNIPKGRREDLFKFIDYCTAAIARVMCGAAEGEIWCPSVLAALAKISTKLKIVSTNPREFAQISVDLGVSNIDLYSSGRQDDQQQQYENRSPNQQSHSGPKQQGPTPMPFTDPGPLLGPLSGQPQFIRADPSAETQIRNREDVVKAVYFRKDKKFFEFATSLLHLILVPLRGKSRFARTSLTSYEVCGMIYETGLERFRTFVFQDQDHDLMGTSNPETINYAHAAVKLLEQTVGHVRDGVKHALTPAHQNNITSVSTSNDETYEHHQTTPSRSESVRSQFLWNYFLDGDISQPTHRVNLESMNNVITVIIPLLLTRPLAACGLQMFVNTAIASELDFERQQKPTKPRAHKRFTGFFYLTTAEDLAVRDSQAKGHALSLSDALMGRNNLLSGKRLTDIGRVASFAQTAIGEGHEVYTRSSKDDPAFLERIQKHQLQLDMLGNRMEEWVMEEKGVMVRCKLYVSLVIALALSLVIGGLVIGLRIGSSIPGVDPFGITTYCWAVAAFSTLIAKSVRVQDWSWNDFLHGRVFCKSVSELSSVTGVNDQLILAKLLDEESLSILKVRGPYNCVFNRKSEDGFSIDRPLSTWTMLLSGLLMVEVESLNGRGLVCLDLRRGTAYKIIKNVPDFDPRDEKREELILCDRLPGAGNRDGQGDLNKIPLKRDKPIAVRCLGFYGNKDAIFV